MPILGHRIWPVRTDKQADKAAGRVLRLQRRRNRIEEDAKTRITHLQDKIGAIRTEESAAVAKVDAVLVPQKDQLLVFANTKRKGKKEYLLPSGRVLVVHNSRSVVAVDGDVKAAIAELEAHGLEKFIRRGEPELDRASLRQVKHGKVFDRLKRLALIRGQSLTIKPPA